MVFYTIWGYDGWFRRGLSTINVNTPLVWRNDKRARMDSFSLSRFCILDALKNYLWRDIVWSHYYNAACRTSTWLDNSTPIFIISALYCYYFRACFNIQQRNCKVLSTVWLNQTVYFIKIIKRDCISLIFEQSYDDLPKLIYPLVFFQYYRVWL